MIEITTGDLLKADVEALVNTVNTVGVMGCGIALQFRDAYLKNYEEYVRACRAGEVRPGRMFVVPLMDGDRLRYIINFPTKRHWRGKARLEDIDTGLEDLVRVVRELRICSLAVPPLGCGNGGLEWEVVRPRIVAALEGINGVRVLQYAPQGAPAARVWKCVDRCRATE